MLLEQTGGDAGIIGEGAGAVIAIGEAGHAEADDVVGFG